MPESHSPPTIKSISLSERSSGSLRLSDPLIALRPKDADTAQSSLDEFLELIDSADFNSLRAGIESEPALREFLAAVFDLSPYLRQLSFRFPGYVCVAHVEGFDAALKQALDHAFLAGDDLIDEAQVMTRLRQAKQQVALVSGLADLGGWWSAQKVSQAISDIADATLQTAVRHLVLNAHRSGKMELPDPDNPETGCGYSVLAMGKHGARELNYSSDIDLIVFFDPGVPAVLDPDESGKLFTRMTRSLVKIMQERTADGYVFRTDLRLRPDPGSMPLAIPLNVALNYYESRGQNWERAALIKARHVAGDRQTGEIVERELVPFIWRRYLDYAAIADIHSIKRQIQAHKGFTKMAAAGHNVKLGRGGIREIEFFVQTQQLIAGGRVPRLRGRRTLEMLAMLVEEGWIDAQVCDELSESYYVLRDVEHRLQMIDDAQTHTIPEDNNEQARLANLCGFGSFDAFASMLLPHLERVEAHYAALFSQAPDLSTTDGNLSFTGDDDDPGTVDTLSTLGYQRPSLMITIVRSWHFGRYRAMQSAEAREQLTEITPALLEVLAETGRPDETLIAFDEFLKGLPAGFQLFSLLKANPRLLSLLVLVLGIAPRLAGIITRKPHVFDGLLEPGFFDTLPTQAMLDEMLARSLAQARSYEDGLDRARVFATEQKFLIGIRVLGGSLDPLEAARAFTVLAQVMLSAMARWVETEFFKTHGCVPGGSFAVVGMGNFGTCELTAGSDLDLIMLYEYSPQAGESDGTKPLHASQYFGRLTQRLIAAMSAATAEGTIYELDFRLRPSGKSGPIATSLDAFIKYQRETAWTWEHMALTRARAVAGNPDFVARVQKEIDTLVAGTREEKTVTKDVLEMRLLMDEQRPTDAIWDVKLAKGGLVDIEFIVQWAVLTGRVSRKETTLATLDELSEQEGGLVTGDFVNAYRTLSNIIQLLRLCLERLVPPQEWPPGLVDLLLRVLDAPDLAQAENQIKDMQTDIRKKMLALLS